MALKQWMLKHIPDNQPSSLSPDEQSRLFGIHPSWITFLDLFEHETALLKSVVDTVRLARQTETIYPAPEHVHRWSHLNEPQSVRVIIVGQDPYHDGSASGVAFGTFPGRQTPASLINVFRELSRTIMNFQPPNHGCLDAWCRQGVLLLNTVFTVVRNKPGSHRHLGWQQLSERIIRQLSETREHLVFMLWGAEAQTREYLIDKTKHLVLKSCHPSPRNTQKSFVGNDHFTLTNNYLQEHGQHTIDWNL
ncbi:uracil-DNA glycosylase [Saimiriine betaherpesvirus 4]|uniref:Uracil-DNA glycosylase n=1 Tax=Saimiriine betaherpesvirus 4 TaxID=1535247 RepID=G8XT11_9BETA|nr:uracil-DNA glycosylase [Saimiriine betaherpesvirus 4]AEV80957.1 uracil-DNA glycosylase [Saimiriine betaherpesvirus 4]